MLTYDAALRLFEAGEFGTLAKNSAHLTHATPESVRLLVAHAMVRAGDAPRVLEWAANWQDRPSALVLGARGRVVPGLALRALGSSQEASRQLQAAVRFAQDADDPSEVAWSRLHLLRHAVDGID